MNEIQTYLAHAQYAYYNISVCIFSYSVRCMTMVTEKVCGCLRSTKLPSTTKCACVCVGVIRLRVFFLPLLFRSFDFFISFIRIFLFVFYERRQMAAFHEYKMNSLTVIVIISVFPPTRNLCVLSCSLILYVSRSLFVLCRNTIHTLHTENGIEFSVHLSLSSLHICMYGGKPEKQKSYHIMCK